MSLEPKSETATSSPAVSTSTNKTNTNLTGVPNVLDDQILPDLVLEQEDPDTSQAMGAVSTEEEMGAAATLLSLGKVRDDTLDGGDNADLMPIGGQNIAIDAAPEPIHLDQVSMDKAIAGLIQSENQDKDKPDQQIEHPTGSTTLDNAEKHKPDRSTGDHDKSEPATKGTLKTRTYALKKKIETKKRSFKCSECNVVKKTIKELNIHHGECHNPQICGVCGKLFKLASSLAWHMYEHNKPKYKCDQCDHMCQFESELQTHKIVHQKNPSHQCMKANCGKWFMRKWDLMLHLQKHDGIRYTCDHDECSFYTDTKKQLKEHQKKHLDDHQHVCVVCGKGFKYRSGLKRHRDKDH